ncbi:hypothetical protein FRACA_20067 [Frankia canadensis]|uniref:Uncharacterized protein n=1 Tax=Frankia canadensis TaxID=1836972 RepID=A0A2I2KPS8_9ACTN|nr:hypothetical protein FRACA_20067 [Frankia canadensis]SOU54961.1 hypothetical protein FRACA_20067 [Frankia canadensis]
MYGHTGRFSLDALTGMTQITTLPTSKWSYT